MPPGSICLPQEAETSQLTAQPKAFLAKEETGSWQPSDTQETLHTFTPDLPVFRLIPAPLSAPPGTISRALIILETLSSRLRKPSLNPDCESFL